MEFTNSIEFLYGMDMEIYAKMAGSSAKNIPPEMWRHSKDLNNCCQ